jgi:hypothetical protein
MKFSTQVLADGLASEIKEHIRREIAEVKGSAASSWRVAELITTVERLERRLEALERERTPAKGVRVRLA